MCSALHKQRPQRLLVALPPLAHQNPRRFFSRAPHGRNCAWDAAHQPTRVERFARSYSPAARTCTFRPALVAPLNRRRAGRAGVAVVTWHEHRICTTCTCWMRVWGGPWAATTPCCGRKTAASPGYARTAGWGPCPGRSASSSTTGTPCTTKTPRMGGWWARTLKCYTPPTAASVTLYR
jgi:hypothetical protein